MKMEVRCCCEPERLLGTIEVPEPMLTHGRSINVAVSIARTMGKEIRYPFVRFEVAEMNNSVLTSSEFDELALVKPPTSHDRWLALKKPHDITIEDLRMLTGFTEAKTARGAG
jgi:hypothetical protein